MSESASTSNATRLLPVFIRMEYAGVLILGAEKKGIGIIKQILNDLPDATVTLADKAIDPELKRDLDLFTHLSIVEDSFNQSLLDHTDMVIVNLDDVSLIASICDEAHQRGIWVHVVDRPELSDFLFNSGLIEREMVNAESSAHLLANVKASGTTHQARSHGEIRWRRIATWSLFAFFFMFIGHLIISFLPLPDMIATIKEGMQQLDRQFYWMIAAGFIAQMVDGVLGMGYGVVSITILMSLGLNLPAISGSIHTAEMFSSGASGYTHYKFGNVNKKLFKTLLIPGIIGAVLGAFLLSTYGEKYAAYFRPLIACYTLLLGVRILIISFRKRTGKPKKVKRVGWLAGIGGFLDSFGGGGWGPLVTSTLISKGRSPRYVIGSVSVTEFFVTLASALTFFTLIGVSYWQIILGLIIGGLIAAPLAARLVGKLPHKVMLVSVGTMVVLWSLRILLKSITG